MRSSVYAVLMMVLVAILVNTVFGADFQVSTASVLSAVLVQAQENGEDDVITLSPGVYQGHFFYRVQDGKSLVIQGAEGTATEDVILDGSKTDIVLTIASSSKTAEVTLSGLTVQGGQGNRRGFVGGGIRITAQEEGSLSVHLRHVIVQYNTTTYHGGGIGVNVKKNGAVSLEIRDSVIRYNDAFGDTAGQYGRGGGIYVTTSSGGNSSVNILIVNSLIYRNRASWTGGGIEMIATGVGDGNTMHATIVNTTITKNISNMNCQGYHAPGGGIYIYGYRENETQIRVDLYNSIINGNETAGGFIGHDLFIGEINPAIVEIHANHCDIGDVLVDNSVGTPTYKFENSIKAWPKFVDPDNDFHLAINSPCIDAGTMDLPIELPDLDLEGNPRICGSGPDIGVYERCLDTDD